MSAKHVLKTGMIEILGEDVAAVDGLVVHIPQKGHAHLGLEMRFQNGIFAPCFVELSGKGAARLAFLHIGTKEFDDIKQKVTVASPTKVPFTLTTGNVRPMATGN